MALDFSGLGDTGAPTPPLNFADLGAKPVQSVQPPAKLDFSDLGGKPVSAPSLSFADLGARQVATPQTAAPSPAIVQPTAAPAPQPPSTWQKIKNAFEYYSSTPIPEVVGHMIGPKAEGALRISGMVQSPTFLSELTGAKLAQSQHPAIAAVGRGIEDVAGFEGGGIRGAESPIGLATSLAGPAEGATKEALPIVSKGIRYGSRVINAAFAAQGAKNVVTPRQPGESAAAYAARIGSGAVQAILPATHLLPERVKAGEVPHATVSVAPDSPVGQVLREPQNAPHVRITDSTAAKDAIESQATVVSPRATVPLKVFHGSSSEAVQQITDLDAKYSRNGLAGKAIYLSPKPEQASAYVANAVGARVVGGELNADVKLMDANAPLPDALQSAAREKFGDDVSGDPKTYLEWIDKLHESVADTGEFQKLVADNAKVDGVRYTAQYSGGPRSAIALFGSDITGKSAADLMAATVPTARVVSPDFVPTVSQSEISNEAVQRIVDNSRELQQLGLDAGKIEHPQDVKAMLDSAAGHIEANIDPRVSVVIGFEAQKSLASELGMDVGDLLARKSGEAWNAEKAVAARALLHDSQTRVLNLARLAAQGDTDYQSQFVRALAQHQAVLETIKGVAAEAGRALGSFRIKESELPQLKISDVFSKLSPEAAQDAANLLAKIDPADSRAVNDFIEQIKPSTPREKFFEYYRNALLSGPHTVIVKSASEAAMLALETMKKAVAGGLEKLTNPTPERFASESWYFAKGAIQALQHAKQVLDGSFSLEDAPGFEGGGEQAIKGTLGKIVRIPQNVLSRGTNLVYMLNYFGELNAQAARQAISEGLDGQEFHARQEWLAHNPTPSMMDAANQTALHGTFQQRLGAFGSGIQNAIRNDPTGISRYLVPFWKTPINLLKATGDYSPYGALKALVGGKEFGGLGERMSRADRLDLTAKALIGSSIAAGIAKLALDGHVTGGGPIDFQKRATLEATGWAPYSIRIGNRYYSYHRFEPLGLALSTVADAVHGAFTHEDPEITQSKADNALQHILRNVENFPFLTTLADIGSIAHGGAGQMASHFIDRQVSGLVPAASATIAQTIDPTIRRPDTLGQSIASRVPGLTRNVPPVLDINGQPAQYPPSRLGNANPFPVSTAKGDPVLSELARLGIATPPAPRSVKLRGEDVQLTPAESQQVAAAEGAEFVQRLGKIISQPGWARRPDSAKRRAIGELRKAIDAQRARRVKDLRERRASALDRLGRDTAQARSLDSLLDEYWIAGPEARSVIEPVINAKIVGERRRILRSAELQRRVSEFSNRLRTQKAAG